MNATEALAKMIDIATSGNYAQIWHEAGQPIDDGWGYEEHHSEGSHIRFSEGHCDANYTASPSSKKINIFCEMHEILTMPLAWAPEDVSDAEFVLIDAAENNYPILIPRPR